MAPRIVIRLDDACAFQRHGPWARIETLLLRLGVRPIVGVVPDCRDPDLVYDAPDPQFWGRVRAWVAEGWGIAMHGLHHRQNPDPPGARALTPFHGEGEFTGLPHEVQASLIARSWQIFQDNGVTPTWFMAPSHSFDLTTLAALKQETSIRWLTDGLSFRPFRRAGFNWLPQQTGRFPALVPPGVWTVAIHPNTLNDAELERLLSRICRRSTLICDPAEIMAHAPARHGMADQLFERAYWTARLARRGLGRSRAPVRRLDLQPAADRTG